MMFTKGGFTHGDIVELDLDDFFEWLESALEIQREINKAMKKAK
jgi:hypothetical protein